jgi:hypothetical protein
MLSPLGGIGAELVQYQTKKFLHPRREKRCRKIKHTMRKLGERYVPALRRF